MVEPTLVLTLLPWSLHVEDGAGVGAGAGGEGRLDPTHLPFTQVPLQVGAHDRGSGSSICGGRIQLRVEESQP